ncbi:hypothetical protein TL16_g04552 [Triparma laevis f. inornata]|uniref:EF-hand domain-containing protein n=1 Tax=Triparma laevis f. inornata TaxID=1714386 RepID=A0A9W7ACX8_9STRA|nr:hypothetical protein TL16_g04552 [Triparma laevis f. inornata]
MMSGGADRLSLVALSHVIQCRRAELMGLRQELQTAAQTHSGTSKTTVSRKDFDHSLATLNIEDSDCEIFDRLFTLFDKTGAGKVNYMEVVVGLSMLVPGTLNDRLMLAFEICDDEGKGYLEKYSLLFLLKTLNLTCNFLGDPTLELETLEELCESVFISSQDTDDLTDAFRYSENGVGAVIDHPIFENWLRSKDGEETKDAGGGLVVPEEHMVGTTEEDRLGLDR